MKRLYAALMIIAHILIVINIIFYLPLVVNFTSAVFASRDISYTGTELLYFNLELLFLLFLPFLMSWLAKLCILPLMIYGFIKNYPNSLFAKCINEDKKDVLKKVLIADTIGFFVLMIIVVIEGVGFYSFSDFCWLVLLQLLSGGGLFVSYLIVFWMLKRGQGNF